MLKHLNVTKKKVNWKKKQYKNKKQPKKQKKTKKNIKEIKGNRRLHKCSYMIRENKTERERAIEEKMIEI